MLHSMRLVPGRPRPGRPRHGVHLVHVHASQPPRVTESGWDSGLTIARATQDPLCHTGLEGIPAWLPWHRPCCLVQW